MTVRTQKELRTIAPAWGFAIAMAVVAGTLTDSYNPFWIFAYLVGLAALAIASFGSEVSYQTLNLILSQPIDRIYLWREKVRLTWVALFSAGLVFAVVFGIRTGATEETSFAVAFYGLLAPLCAAGGGLCLILLLKHVQGALWLGLLIPAAIVVGVISVVLPVLPESLRESSLIPALALIAYSAAGYWFARRTFLRMQDLDALNTNWSIQLPSFPSRRREKAGGALWALFRKEMLLQQINWILAILLLASIIVCGLLHSNATQSLQRTIEAAQRLLSYFVCALLPLMIGAASIAEERRLGLSEWQRVLPIAQWKQWLVKYLLCFALSLLFSSGVSGLVFSDGVEVSFAHLTAWGMIPLLAVTIGMWGSSVTRNALHATVVAVCGTVAMIIAFRMTSQWIGGIAPSVSPTPLFVMIVVPCLFVVVLASAYRNFRIEVATPLQFLRSCWIITAAFLGLTLLTACIFKRAWEVFIPEAKPGPELLVSQSAKQVALDVGFYDVTVFCSDGRLWNSEILPSRSNNSGSDVILRPGQLSRFSDWISVSSSRSHGLGVRSDGTLWGWGWNYMGELGVGGDVGPKARPQAPEPFQQIGSDSNWIAVATAGRHSLGIKQDGSLWAWGDNSQGQLGIPGIAHAPRPERVGSRVDWKTVIATPWSSVGVTGNGELLKWGSATPFKGESAEPRLLDDEANWTTVFRVFPESFAAVRDDGSVWVRGYGLFGNIAPVIGSELVPLKMTDPPRALTVNSATAMTVRSDGSLWRIEANQRALEKYRALLRSNPGTTSEIPEVLSSSRVGHRNDWLAVSCMGGSWFGLTADGWLWTWGNPVRDAFWVTAETLFSINKWFFGEETLNRGNTQSHRLLIPHSQRPRQYYNLLTGEAK